MTTDPISLRASDMDIGTVNNILAINSVKTSATGTNTKTVNFNVDNTVSLESYAIRLDVEGTRTIVYTLPIVVVATSTLTADSDGDGISDANDGANGLQTRAPDANSTATFKVLADSSNADLIIRAGATARALDKLDIGTSTIAGGAEADENTHTGGTYDVELSNFALNEKVLFILPLTEVIPANAQYRKLHPDNDWRNFNGNGNTDGAQSALGIFGDCSRVTAWGAYGTASEGHNCVRITLTDGGEWDRDGVANGVILDPFGIYSGSGSGSGGSSGFGCTLSQQPNSNHSTKFDPSLYILLMLAIVGLLRKRLNLF